MGIPLGRISLPERQRRACPPDRAHPATAYFARLLLPRHRAASDGGRLRVSNACVREARFRCRHERLRRLVSALGCARRVALYRRRPRAASTRHRCSDWKSPHRRLWRRRANACGGVSRFSTAGAHCNAGVRQGRPDHLRANPVVLVYRHGCRDCHDDLRVHQCRDAVRIAARELLRGARSIG